MDAGWAMSDLIAIIEVNDPEMEEAGRSRFTQRLLFASAEAASDRRSASGSGSLFGPGAGGGSIGGLGGLSGGTGCFGFGSWLCMASAKQDVCRVPGGLAHTPVRATARRSHIFEVWMFMRSIPGAQVGIV